MIENINTQQTNTIGNTRCLIGTDYLKSTFFTDNCFVVVDGSFFPEYLEFIIAYWFFVIRMQLIGTESFVAKVNRDLQSLFAAEVCRGLGVLLLVLKV